MTRFPAKVTRDIPANRLLNLGGIGTEGDEDEGWETVYLILCHKGALPDLVSTGSLTEGDVVNVNITGAPSWRVEASQRLPAGSLVQADEDGRVKVYHYKDGQHVGFTTHSAEPGEVVTVIRKPGRTADPES